MAIRGSHCSHVSRTALVSTGHWECDRVLPTGFLPTVLLWSQCFSFRCRDYLLKELFVFCAVVVKTATQANTTPEWQHTLESEPSWSQEYKQLLHSFPKFRLKPKMEMQCTEWDEGKKPKQRKTSATTNQRRTDRQTVRQTEMACRELYHSAIHSSVPQHGYKRIWRARVYRVSSRWENEPVSGV